MFADFPAELHRHPLDGARRVGRHLHTDLGGPGEDDLGQVRMANEGSAGHRAATRDDIVRARRQLGLKDYLRECEG